MFGIVRIQSIHVSPVDMSISRSESAKLRCNSNVYSFLETFQVRKIIGAEKLPEYLKVVKEYRVVSTV